MDRPKTTHKGLPIWFSEVDDMWHCSAIDKRNVSLSRLKKAIDTWDRNVRKAAKVPAYKLELSLPLPRKGSDRGQGDPGACFIPTEIVEYVGLSRYAKRIEVAATPENGHRRKFNVESLVKDTPENHAILTRANEVAGEVWPLLGRFQMILEELEYLSEEDVAGLKEIFDREVEDED